MPESFEVTVKVKMEDILEFLPSDALGELVATFMDAADAALGGEADETYVNVLATISALAVEKAARAAAARGCRRAKIEKIASSRILGDVVELTFLITCKGR